jgi:4-hydroxybenzoate polyprenyltransferase
MKYGVALIYAGLLAFALDRGHTLQHLLPACVGAFVVALACLSARLKRWHYTPLQCNTMMFIGMVFWAGGVLTRNLTPSTIFCGIAVFLLSSLGLFITSESFQQEPKNLDDLVKTNGSSQAIETRQ